LLKVITLNKRALLFFVFCAYFSNGLSQAEHKILPAEKIIKLIPDKVKEYHQSTDPISKVIKFGTIQYSMAEKNFSASHRRSIKILLFDYKEAPIMYKQATRKFSNFVPVESDSVILRALTMTDCTGWESYNVQRKNSQILIGICDRFFLTVEGTGVDLDTLKEFVQEFKFEAFPK
jgi:hypothetical protein